MAVLKSNLPTVGDRLLKKNVAVAAAAEAPVVPKGAKQAPKALVMKSKATAT